MKKLIPVFLLFIVGCKTDPKVKALPAIRPYIASKIGEGNKISDIEVFKVDTATQLQQIEYHAEFLYNLIEKKAPINKINAEALERTIKMFQQSNADEYFSNRVKEVKAEYDKYYNEEIKPSMDELDVLQAQSKKADSTKFLAYRANAVLKYVTASNAQKIDTVVVLLNKDFKVIERKDFWENKF